MNTTNCVYGKRIPLAEQIINSDTRDRHMRPVQYHVKRFDCELVQAPSIFGGPVIDKAPGLYFAVRLYTTFGGAEYGVRTKPDFFDSERDREVFIESKIRAFKARQHNRRS